MRSLNLIIFILFISPLSTSGQSLQYDVVRNGESMGTSTVSRVESGNSVSYHLNTKTEFRILFLFKVEYDLKETFTNNTLIKGSAFNTLNGSTQKETEMQKKDGYYELIIDGIRTEVNENKITESVSEIYFEEPYDGKKVYSAYFARFLSFTKIGNHKYELVSPDGTNTYTYVNGIVSEVKISRDFATFSQVLKPEILAAVRNREIPFAK